MPIWGEAEIGRRARVLARYLRRYGIDALVARMEAQERRDGPIAPYRE